MECWMMDRKILYLSFYKNQGKIKSWERGSDSFTKIDENLKRVIDSQEGASRKNIEVAFVGSSQSAKDIRFIAPRNTGESWNGRKMRVVSNDMPRECRSTEGRPQGGGYPWRTPYHHQGFHS